jgi:MarR family transcriptional regulator, organic hydroperoxide resistance regulator
VHPGEPYRDETAAPDGAEACPGEAPWQWPQDVAAITEDAPMHTLILVAVRLMGIYWGDTVRTTGVRISPAGLGVLRLLLEHDGLKSSEVAARGMTSPGTTTTVVSTLVKDGYVERRPDPADRRVVRLHVTEKGIQACQEYLTLAGPRWRKAFDFVTAADEAVVRRFFVQMIRRFNTLAREERGK